MPALTATQRGGHGLVSVLRAAAEQSEMLNFAATKIREKCLEVETDLEGKVKSIPIVFLVKASGIFACQI